MQVRCLTCKNVLGVGLEGGGNFSGGKFLDLLRGAADKSGGVQKGIQLGNDGLEESSAADTLDQIVVLALLLNIVGGLVRENT